MFILERTGIQMKEKILSLLKQIKNRDFIILSIIFFICAFTQIDFFIEKLGTGEIPVRTHDSYWYLDYSREFLQSLTIKPDFNGIFYFSYYGLLAIVLKVFRSDLAMVLIQVALNTVCVVFLYLIARDIFGRWTAVIASYFYIMSRELKMWSLYILTDSLYVSILIISVFLWVRFEKEKKRKYLFAFLGCMLYLSFLRPAGLIIVAFFMLYLVLKIDIKKAALRWRKNKMILIAALLFIGASIFSGLYILYNTKLGMSFYSNLRWLLHVNYATGTVFDFPTPYDYVYKAEKTRDIAGNFVLSFFVQNFKHIMILYGKRFICFWGELWIWDTHFGRKLEIIQYFWRLMPIILTFWGMVSAAVKGRADKTLILYVPVISTVTFCMVFFLDSAWRYRLPSLPFNYIFCAYAIYSIVSFASSKVMKIKEQGRAQSF